MIEDEKLIEILKKESPFFIKDIVAKYDVTQGHLWHFLNVKYAAIFKSELVRNGNKGRPSYRWTI